MPDREAENPWGSRVLITCAVLVTLLVARRELGGTRTTEETTQNRQITNWERLLVGGNRIGAESAKVVIIEFGDFECPACRGFTVGTLRPILLAHPNDVAVVFQHWPLNCHRFALPAARAAECAGSEGRFEAMHDLLYDKQDSLGLKPLIAYGIEAGVQDSTRFAACLAETGTVPRIEAGIRDAKSIEAPGTPAIIIGGKLLGKLPTKDQLEALIKNQLAGHSR